MKNAKFWLKGLLMGLGLILVAVLMTVIVVITVGLIGGIAMPPDDALLAFLFMWYMNIVGLILFGFLPIKTSGAAQLTRWIFIWLPVALGWYLIHHGWPMAVLSAGMLISSTCVGYDWAVALNRRLHKPRE